MNNVHQGQQKLEYDPSSSVDGYLAELLKGLSSTDSTMTEGTLLRVLTGEFHSRKVPDGSLDKVVFILLQW